MTVLPMRAVIRPNPNSLRASARGSALTTVLFILALAAVAWIAMYRASADCRASDWSIIRLLRQQVAGCAAELVEADAASDSTWTLQQDQWRAPVWNDSSKASWEDVRVRVCYRDGAHERIFVSGGGCVPPLANAACPAVAKRSCAEITKVPGAAQIEVFLPDAVPDATGTWTTLDAGHAPLPAPRVDPKRTTRSQAKKASRR